MDMPGAAWATNLLDLPHALLEHISTELVSVRSVGRYACACSLLRQLIAEHGPVWRAHLPACQAAATSQDPRLALRDLTTLAAARWTDITPRLAEAAPGTVADSTLLEQFTDGQPDSQVAHSAFTCNAGKTLVVVGVQRHTNYLSAWAVDLSAQPTRWQEAAPPASPIVVDGTHPTARRFTADGGGGGVLLDGAGREWLCLFGGLIVDANGRPRYRDNETWLLGPLGAAAECAQWRWWQVQDDDEAQSEERPTPRFHHSQTVLRRFDDASGRYDDALAVCGGNDYTMAPLLELATLSLCGVDLAPPAEGEEPGPPPLLTEVEWDFEGGSEEDGPQPRSRHAAANWERLGLIICGGEDVDDDDDDDENDITAEVWLYQFGMAGPKWMQLPDMPHKRTRAAAVVVAKSELLVVCGGMGGGDPAAVWVLPLRPLVDPTRPHAACVPAGGGLRWAELSLRRGLESPRLDATLCVAHGDILVLGGGHCGEDLDSFGDATSSFWAEGETCAWRLLHVDGDEDGDGAGAVSPMARCRTCAAGLLLEPIRAADPDPTAGGASASANAGATGAGARLTKDTQRLLYHQLTTESCLRQLQAAPVRLVDSGEVGRCLAPPNADAPYNVPMRVVSSSRTLMDIVTGTDTELPRVEVSLDNVRPRLVGQGLGRVTVVSCAAGVVAARGWIDPWLKMVCEGSAGQRRAVRAAQGMSARRLSFVQ